MHEFGVYDNRELSWLKFNQRVLEEAQDGNVPLFERLRFVSIFCSNLDEFFMIRVGTLYDQTLLKKESRENKTNLTAREQLGYIAQRVAALLPQKDAAYEEIMQHMTAYGVVQVDIENLSDDDRLYLELFFKREIQPLLFTSVIDKKHPLPFLRSGEIYVGGFLRKKDDTKQIFGVVPAAGAFDRVIFLPGDGVRFVLAEDVIRHFIHQIFPNFEVEKRSIFRVTRNADINADEALFDHDVDFRDVMSELIKKRKKLAPIRLEFMGEVDTETCAVLMKHLEIEPDFVCMQSTPLDMSFIGAVEDRIQEKRELFFNPLTPQRSDSISKSEPLIKQLLRKDVLLTYPYESINPFINLLEEAAADPNVVSIKITLYRVARDSKIINALIKAVENGKDVLALVELRARFDEENNIGWSKQLEDAGANVIYGLDGLKVHSKLLLITRKNGNAIQYITQVGTGNYNERTSKLYTDITLMTSDKDIGADASVVFNALSVGTTVESTSKLLVAPQVLKSRIVTMIDNEITYGNDGYIGIKINSLTDKDIIEKLIEASQKGVKIELIVRGICCLVAGVKGYTENVKIISIVGRFLEHSRIYIFGKDERQRVYISSADFMTRNTERRVEVAAPIKDSAIRARVVEMFNTMLNDNVKARIQYSDGLYRRKEAAPGETELNSQAYFYERAYERAEAAIEHENALAKRSIFAKVIDWFKKEK